ncbi:MAG: 2-C-methyl-D-erythritol 2,4-cyclodiphosphate synthase [Candidatus Beckwithbacteria bacterium]
MFRVGLGQDSHRLTKGKPLILAGVRIEFESGLEADSDGDVIIHSLGNALSTAVGGGSLDTWAGEMFRNGITDSREFLKKILEKIIKEKYSISNVSIMVEAKQPKLEEYREKMKASIAKIMKIEADQVGIAFTTGEGLSEFGKGKGIQAISTVLIEK